MKHLFLFLLTVFFATTVSAKDYVALFGKGTSQRYLPGVEQNCPENHICSDVFYVWTIRVDQVLSGKLPAKTVKATMIQHTKYVNAHKQLALFVLSRIESEEKRKLYGTDYWIKEYVPPATLYCPGESGKKYGIENRQFGDTNCYVHHKQLDSTE